MTTKLPRHALGMQVFFIASAALYVLCQRFGQFWSISTDAAQHYALIARISQLYSLPSSIDPSLGEMNVYPAGSHAIAAILGVVMHSPFAGMHLTSLLAVMLLWGAVMYMLLTLPRKAGVISFVCLMVLLALNRQLLQLEIFGHEIAENYFFAQLLGYAAAFAALALLQYMELTHTARWQRHAFALLALYFIINLHLLPALQLLLCYCLCQWLDVALHYRRRKAYRWRLLEALLISGLSLTLLLKHPYFQAMKKISQNNGGLILHFFNDVHSIVILALVVALASAALLWYWLKQESLGNGQLAHKYLASLGLAVAVLCLLQAISLMLGSGSIYAVKKYVFGLNSMALLELALAAPLLTQIYLPRWSRETLARSQLHAIALPGLGVLLCSLLILPSTSHFQTAKFIRAEQHITQLLATELNSTSTRKFHYVAELDQLPPMANYMFSLGLTQTPRRPDHLTELNAQNIQDFADFDHIITADKSLLAKRYTCRKRTDADGFAVLDGLCLRQALHLTATDPAREIDFSDAASSASCELSGFGEIESFGRWTTKQQAHLRCQLPPLVTKSTPTQIEINVLAFIPPSGKQLLQIGIDGKNQEDVWFDSKNTTKNIVLPLPANIGTQLDLTLSLPLAKSPKELGMSADLRVLGVGLHSIRFK